MGAKVGESSWKRATPFRCIHGHRLLPFSSEDNLIFIYDDLFVKLKGMDSALHYSRFVKPSSWLNSQDYKKIYKFTLTLVPQVFTPNVNRAIDLSSSLALQVVSRSEIL